MALELRGFKVFLCSPGGLESERELFYRIAFEVNEIEAEACRRTLIPIGWERSTKGWGRPQTRLNTQLESCDFVVLILADKWGSPTGPDGTGYSSGTEEEYRLARECLLSTDHPLQDILVLFKGVPERQMADPGPQLKKVLDFKEDLEQEKSLFFATFDDEKDLSRILRLHLHRWLRGEEDPPGETPSKRPPPTRPPAGDGQQGPGEESSSTSPLGDAEELASEGRRSMAERRFAEAVGGATENYEARLQYARFLRHEGRLTHAIEVSKELIAAARERGQSKWLVAGLGNLGVTQRRAGKLSASQASLTEAIELAGEEPGERRELAYLENNLGLTLRLNGLLSEAESHYQRAREIYEEMRDGEGLAYAHVNLSYAMREQGDLTGARGHAKDVLSIEEANARSLAMAHCNLGLIAEDEEEFAEAERCFETASALNGEIGNDFGQGMNYAHLARVKLEQGQEEEALMYGGRALELNQWSGNSEGIALSLHVIGTIDLGQRKYKVAESRLKDAGDIYEALGHRVANAMTQVELAALMGRTSRFEEAEQMLTEARKTAEGTRHARLTKRLAEVDRNVSEAAEAEQR